MNNVIKHNSTDNGSMTLHSTLHNTKFIIIIMLTCSYYCQPISNKNSESNTLRTTSRVFTFLWRLLRDYVCNA